MNPSVIFQDLGKIDYQQAWDYQEELFNKIVEQKILNRQSDPSAQKTPENHLLFCEHPHVYTLGKSGSISNLLLTESGLREKEASFYKINRGGDITYHGPGQIVGYPIFDLDQFFTDIHKYLRFLEEAVILTLKNFGLSAYRMEGLTGVWVKDEENEKPRKICAIGVKCSRWVTMHGFAFNVNTNLNYFGHIIPCGIDDKGVTSMEKELGKKVDISSVKEDLLYTLKSLFQWDWKNNAEPKKLTLQ